MWNDRRCAGCGTRGWSPCHGCVVTLLAAGPVDVEGARKTEALLDYVGVTRDLIHSFKYGGARDLGRWFGEAMARRVSSDVDMITWVPTTARRRRERGYDQAQLLARAGGRLTQLPVRRLLRRSDADPPQTGRSATERLRGPRLVSSAVEGLRVVVIDDVVTTGTSAANAVTALLHRGALSVDVVVIARTPPPSRSRSR